MVYMSLIVNLIGQRSRGVIGRLSVGHIIIILTIIIIMMMMMMMMMMILNFKGQTFIKMFNRVS